MLTNKSPETSKDAPKEPKATPKTTRKSQATLFDETAVASPAAEIATGRKAPLANTSATSRVIIKYDVGFQNHLTIRGKGANLSWTKGIPLKNKGSDEWVWETDAAFSSLEYKVLINDYHYEEGENHLLKQGQTVHYTPRF
jgi:hypothetical protein